MRDLGIPELSGKQTEELCAIAEEAARKYVHGKVSKKKLNKLDISDEVFGTRPVSDNIDVNVKVSLLLRDFKVQKLLNDAIKEAFEAIGEHLRERSCHSLR